LCWAEAFISVRLLNNLLLELSNTNSIFLRLPNLTYQPHGGRSPDFFGARINQVDVLWDWPTKSSKKYPTHWLIDCLYFRTHGLVLDEWALRLVWATVAGLLFAGALLGGQLVEVADWTYLCNAWKLNFKTN
jgi:hypothetical protein